MPVPTLQVALQMLREGGLDAYATNKSVLFELSDKLPGARVLAGRWGSEHLAIAYSKGRESAAPFFGDFCAPCSSGWALSGCCAARRAPR